MVTRHKLSGLTPLLWLAVALAALLAACAKDKNPRFPHVLHLTELECGEPGKPACLTCNTCHSPSKEGRVDKLPEPSLCGRCHEGESARMARVLGARPYRPYGEIIFDHGRHLRMDSINGQCVSCHGAAGTGPDNLPPMSRCFACHEHKAEWEQGSCSRCHMRSDLEKTLPVTFLRHDAAFLRQHGSVAAAKDSLCKGCHSQSDCQACHDLTQMIGVDQRMPEKFDTKQVHRGDFMVRHPIEAQSEPASCMRCHEPASCDACHVERGVSGNALGASNPHPPGWIGRNPDAADFHGRAARRDLLSCAACHEAGPATNCIRCHKVGGYGGNPHPGGWRSARSTDESMCAYCHEGGP